MKKGALGLLIVLSTGCHATETKETPTGTQFHYQCEKQPLMVIINNPKQQAYLTINGRPQFLPAVVSASGAKYSNGEYTFWSKGDSAMVMHNEQIIIDNCVLIP